MDKKENRNDISNNEIVVTQKMINAALHLITPASPYTDVEEELTKIYCAMETARKKSC